MSLFRIVLFFYFCTISISWGNYYQSASPYAPTDSLYNNNSYGGFNQVPAPVIVNSAPVMAAPVDMGYYGGANPYINNSYYSGGGYYGGPTNTFFDHFIPNRIIVEPYIYLHYNLGSAAYYNTDGGLSYSGIYNKTLPRGFGGAIGFRLNNILLIEFDITGMADKKSFTISGQNYSQRTDFVFMRLNLGISFPLSGVNYNGYQSFSQALFAQHHHKKVNLLILGGFMFGVRNVVFSGGSPANTLGTTIGVLPEVGGGLEYWLNHRFGVRTTFRYAFQGTDPVLKSLFTWDFGIQIKL